VTEVTATENTDNQGEEQGNPLFQNPLFELSEDEIRQGYDDGLYNETSVRDYKTYHALQNSSYLDLDEDRIKYAYDRGFITEGMARAYKEYKEQPEWNPAASRGQYELNALMAGQKLEDVWGEVGDPMMLMDPVDVLIDIGTGGISALMRGGMKVGAKAVAKEMGKDVVIGRVAAGAMDAIGAAGGGTVSQIIAGITSPAIAQVFAVAGKRALVEYIKGLRKGSPEIAENIEKVVKSHPEDEMSKKMRNVFEELDEKGIFQADEVKPTKKGAAPEPHTQEKVAESAKVLDEILESNAEGFNSKLLERAEANGMSGADIVDSINRSVQKRIDTARGGPLKDRGTHKSRVSDKEVDQQVQNHVKRLSNNMGMKHVKLEKALQMAHDVKLSTNQLASKAKAINEVMTSYGEQTAKFIKERIDDVQEAKFSDKLKAMEHIRILAELQEAVFGIRAEMGRGMRVWSDFGLKNRFDFDAIPRSEFDTIRKSTEPEIDKMLNYFRKARDPKLRNLRAKNLMRNRFMKGLLELEQAMLLSHPVTQVVNVLGSSYAVGIEMASRYAGIRYNAWQQAQGIRNPLKFDNKAMQEWYFQKEALKKSLVDSFKVEGGWKGLVKNPKKAIMSGESGDMWKALISGEPQVDKMVKYEGQSLGAIPDYLKIGMMKLPMGKVIRLPFHGLTAGDEVFKGIGYRTELNRRLYRAAVEEGCETQEQIGRFIETQMHNLDPALHYQALNQARYQTYTDHLDPFTGAIERALNTNVGIIGRMLFVPFYKVTVNLPKYALQQTPLGLAAQWQRDVLKNGSAQDKVELLARWAMGSSVLAAGYAMHQAGLITGRTPSDQREIHNANDVQAYSFVHKKKDGRVEFLDYSRQDPLAFLIGIGADLSAAAKIHSWYNEDVEESGTSDLDGVQDVMMAYLLAFTEPLMNKTVTKSMKEGMELLTQPERMNLSKWGLKQVGKFYPRLFDLAHSMVGANDVMREARTVAEQFWAKTVPSKAAPKRHIIYGEVVPRHDRVMGIINRSPMSQDPVLNRMLEVRCNVRKPSQKGNSKRFGPWEMTDAQYDEYNKRISESGMKESLTELVANLEDVGDHALVADQIRNHISRWRKVIRDEMLWGDGGILDKDEVERRMLRRADAIAGNTIIKDLTTRNFTWLDRATGR